MLADMLSAVFKAIGVVTTVIVLTISALVATPSFRDGAMTGYRAACIKAAKDSVGWNQRDHSRDETLVFALTSLSACRADQREVQIIYTELLRRLGAQGQ